MCYLSYTQRYLESDAFAHTSCHRFRSDDRRLNLRFRVWGGKYVWEHELMVGGQGLTWTAYDLFKSDKFVVIKTVNTNPDPGEDDAWGGYTKRMSAKKDELRHEVSIIPRLNHDNIIRLLETWESPGGEAGEQEWERVPDVFMALPKYEGDLTALLESDFVKSIEHGGVLVRSVGKQIMSALGHCHGVHNMLHRDVKPMNILWCRVEGGFRFVLTDFGLAREYPGTLNPNFAAPDYYWYPPEYYTQPSRQEPAGDIWMLGMTLLWLVDEEKLRTDGRGKLTMPQVWDRAESASKSNRWQKWKGMLALNIDRRSSRRDLIKATNSFKKGPEIYGPVPPFEPDHNCTWPRTTKTRRHVERDSGEWRRCWHDEMLDGRASDLGTTPQCVCERY